MSQIRRLEESVINRIAAGEIINRAENVVKELLENCLDAGANLIGVGVKDGGLKQLIISDNGKGIRKSDFHLVCERFCTSKLAEFNDLKTIATYGFRGEALASVSHIAHVTVISRTADSPCAFKGVYSDGALIHPPGSKGNVKDKAVEPKPIAGNIGTQIFVEDLFYNIPIRKAAFKNAQEEYNRILTVVQKYAIFNAGVAFSCKKIGTNQSDVQTSANASQLDNIRIIYGDALSKEVLKFNYTNKEDSKGSFTVTGWVSNANYSLKKKEFTLFINNRLVDCPSLRKTVDAIYTKYLPKSGNLFAFLSLTLPPESIDVNVHPTKKLVHFMYQDAIVSEIGEALDTCLQTSTKSRVFHVPVRPPPLSNVKKQMTLVRPLTSLNAQKSKPQGMVRTDSRTRTLDSFFAPTPVAKKVRGEENCGSDAPIDANKSREVVEVVGDDDEVQEPETITVGEEDVQDGELDELQQDIQDEVDDVVELSFVDLSQNSLQGQYTLSDATRNVQNRQPATILVEEIIASEIEDSQMEDSQHEVSQQECAEEVSEQDEPDISEDQRSLHSQQHQKARPFISVQLDSILSLRQEIMDSESLGVSAIFADHTFVGCYDTSLALIQHKTQLMVIDYSRISVDFMYQLVMYGFSNFGVLEVEDVPLYELALIGLSQSEWNEQEHDPVDVIAQRIVEEIVGMREMLEEYFQIHVSQDGVLRGLPVLLPGYNPSSVKLPSFVLALGGAVDYSIEKECFRDVAVALAQFYSFEYLEGEEEEYKYSVQHHLFSELTNCIGMEAWSSDVGGSPCIREVANLQELYKIFERC